MRTLSRVKEVLRFAKTFKFRTREKKKNGNPGPMASVKRNERSGADVMYERFLALGHDSQRNKLTTRYTMGVGDEVDRLEINKLQ